MINTQNKLLILVGIVGVFMLGWSLSYKQEIPLTPNIIDPMTHVCDYDHYYISYDNKTYHVAHDTVTFVIGSIEFINTTTHETTKLPIWYSDRNGSMVIRNVTIFRKVKPSEDEPQ